MPADIVIDKEYRVGEGPVRLSLVIGDGQFGRSDIKLNTLRIVRVSGSIGNLFVGHGTDISGKTLRIRTIVNDTVAATNRMSVTYKLTGGPADREFTSKGEVETEGGNLVFDANVELT